MEQSLRKGKRKNRSCELKSQNVEEKEEVGGCTHVKRSGGCIHVKKKVGVASMLKEVGVHPCCKKK